MEEEKKSHWEGAPLRRSLFAVSAAERKRYFWCLKAIGFLPAHSKNRVYFLRGADTSAEPNQKLVNPQTIQDELMGSHATVCEHHTIYFAHYHRHLTAVFEMELSYAQQYLLGLHRDDPFYLTHKVQFDIVIDQFTKLLAQNPQVSNTKPIAHYWNPTHYISDKDILPPVELLDPVFAKRFLPKQFQTYELEPIDILFEQVNKSYPWEFNFKQKWFKNGKFQQSRTAFKNNLTQVIPTKEEQKKSQKQKDNQGDTYFYPSKQISYSKNIQKIFKGQLTPRVENDDKDHQLADYFEGFLGPDYDKTQQMQLFTQISAACKLRSTFYFDHGYAQGETNNSKPISTEKMRNWNLHHEQSLSSFGAHSKNLHWISQKQMSYYKYSNYYKQRAQVYNSNLPHYQIANAYFSKEKEDFLTFLTDRHISKVDFESAHNGIHNYNQYFMKDGNFSISNLVFFAYHSYIDMALELKIREIATVQYQKTIEQLQQLGNRHQVYEFLLFPGKNRRVNKGEYMVMEWANPALAERKEQNIDIDPHLKFTVDDLEYPFTFYEYCLNVKAKSIRRSYQFDQLYSRTFQLDPDNIKKYQTFKGFKDYNFDYNYEIYQYDVTQDITTGAVSIVYCDEGKTQPKVIKTILTDKAYYPKYIQLIKSDVQTRKDIIKKAVNRVKDSYQVIKQAIGNKLHKITQYIENIGISSRLYPLILNQPLVFVGHYLSSISNGIYKFSIAADNAYKPQLFEGSHLDATISKKLKTGLDITCLNIFGRNGINGHCARCKEKKYFSIDVHENIQTSCPDLQNILTSYQNSSNPLRYSDKPGASPSNNTLQGVLKASMLSDFQNLTLVQGAEQIQMFTKFYGDSNIKGEIKVDAISHSIYSGQIKGLVTHRNDDSIDAKFDFDKIILIASNIPDDKAIFTQLRIKIHLKTSQVSETRLVHFDIRGYFRVIRYDLIVTAQEVDGRFEASLEIYDKDQQSRSQYISIYTELAKSAL